MATGKGRQWCLVVGGAWWLDGGAASTCTALNKVTMAPSGVLGTPAKAFEGLDVADGSLMVTRMTGAIVVMVDMVAPPGGAIGAKRHPLPCD